MKKKLKVFGVEIISIIVPLEWLSLFVFLRPAKNTEKLYCQKWITSSVLEKLSYVSGVERGIMFSNSWCSLLNDVSLK